jgi:hypothetical protein
MEEVNVLTDEQTTQVEEAKEGIKEEVTTQVEVPVEEPKPTQEERFEKKKKTFQERINEKTAENYRLKKELEEERKKTKVESEIPKAPNPQKFVDEYGNFEEDKWNSAMAEYNEKYSDHRDSKKKQEEVVQVTKEEEEAKQKNWEDVAIRAIEKYPDLQEVTNKDVYNPVLIDVLRDKSKIDIEEDTTVSADLAYYLGKNPVELARINKLAKNDPVNMIIELGKIQGKLESLTKNVSNAPKPLETLDAEKGSLKDSEEFPDGKDDEWFQWRKKQKLEKLKRK